MTTHPSSDSGLQLSPAVEELLEQFDETSARPLSPEERRVELVGGLIFVAVATALALLVPWRGEADWPQIALLVGAYTLASRVRFAIGYGFTVPTQLVFIPMLMLAPAPLLPALVAVASILGNLPDWLRGRTPASRSLLAVGDSWHALGPALVLIVAGVPAGPPFSAWPIYAGAVVAQFLFDFAFSTLREWLWLRVPPKLQLGLWGWVGLVDVLLTPIGALAALAAATTPLAPIATLPLAALLAVFARERDARMRQALELSRAYRGTTLLLGDVLEADDEYTGVHSRTVVSLAVAVADEMGLDSRERRVVEFGALLHDVGKIAIPKELINKPGPLTPEEWLVVKTHTVAGQEMLDRVGGVFEKIGHVVRSSHERWDGGGYPDGLAGEEIPLASAIVACSDAFNAMTTDRPYRKGMPVEDALAELRSCAGSQFHPRVVDVLARVVERSLAPSDEATEPSPTGALARVS
jgi:putative nucleotidyltransferase with HDIG domain